MLGNVAVANAWPGVRLIVAPRARRHRVDARAEIGNLELILQRRHVVPAVGPERRRRARSTEAAVRDDRRREVQLHDERRPAGHHDRRIDRRRRQVIVEADGAERPIPDRRDAFLENRQLTRRLVGRVRREDVEAGVERAFRRRDAAERVLDLLHQTVGAARSRYCRREIDVDRRLVVPALRRGPVRRILEAPGDRRRVTEVAAHGHGVGLRRPGLHRRVRCVEAGRARAEPDRADGLGRRRDAIEHEAEFEVAAGRNREIRRGEVRQRTAALVERVDDHAAGRRRHDRRFTRREAGRRHRRHDVVNGPGVAVRQRDVHADRHGRVVRRHRLRIRERRDVQFRLVEELHAVVVGVGDDQAAELVEGHRGRLLERADGPRGVRYGERDDAAERQVRGADAGRNRRERRRWIRGVEFREDRDAVVGGVGDEQAVVRIERERPRRRQPFGDRLQRVAAGVEHLNRNQLRVVGVRDVDMARGVAREARRIVELAGADALRTERRLHRPPGAGADTAGRLQLQHAIVRRVEDDDAADAGRQVHAVGRIGDEGDGPRLVERVAGRAVRECRDRRGRVAAARRRERVQPVRPEIRDQHHAVVVHNRAVGDAERHVERSDVGAGRIRILRVMIRREAQQPGVIAVRHDPLVRQPVLGDAVGERHQRRIRIEAEDIGRGRRNRSVRDGCRRPVQRDAGAVEHDHGRPGFLRPRDAAAERAGERENEQN